MTEQRPAEPRTTDPAALLAGARPVPTAPATGKTTPHLPWCVDCKKKHQSTELDSDTRCAECARAAITRAAAAERRLAQQPQPATEPSVAPSRQAPAEPLELVDVPVGDLHPDPDNPRQDVGDITDLADSMVTAGLLQPIVARRDPAGRLIVIAGHRRLAAAIHLQWPQVACVVRRDMAPDRVLAAMLIENSQRTDLDPIEEARALSKLSGDNQLRSHRDLANLIGRNQTYVSSRLSLLALPIEEQEALRARQLNLGDAIRRARLASGRVRPAGVTGSPHLGVDHDLSGRARARCTRLGHSSKGRNSVGGVACGDCWENVIRADERQHLNDRSNQRGRCVLCDTETA